VSRRRRRVYVVDSRAVEWECKVKQKSRVLFALFCCSSRFSTGWTGNEKLSGRHQTQICVGRCESRIAINKFKRRLTIIVVFRESDLPDFKFPRINSTPQQSSLSPSPCSTSSPTTTTSPSPPYLHDPNHSLSTDCHTSSPHTNSTLLQNCGLYRPDADSPTMSALLNPRQAEELYAVFLRPSLPNTNSNIDTNP